MVPAEERTPSLPAGLFHNGWIHLLEDTEINFLLMLAWLHFRFGAQPVFVASDIRLRQFGLGKDAYEAHRMLNRFGLVDVEEDPNRDFDGYLVTGYNEGTMPKLHRFVLARASMRRPCPRSAQQSTDACDEGVWPRYASMGQ